MKNFVLLLMFFFSGCSYDRVTENLGQIVKLDNKNLEYSYIVVKNNNTLKLYEINTDKVEIFEGSPRVYVEYDSYKLFSKELEIRDALRTKFHYLFNSKIRIYIPNLDSINQYIAY